MKRLNEIVSTLKLMNGNFYWVKAVKNIYKLSDAEAGYIITKLK